MWEAVSECGTVLKDDNLFCVIFGCLLALNNQERGAAMYFR